jgi:hypothetical protein
MSHWCHVSVLSRHHVTTCASGSAASITPAPGGQIAVVLGTYDGTVRLLDTRTHTASRPIKVGALPVAAAITR